MDGRGHIPYVLRISKCTTTTAGGFACSYVVGLRFTGTAAGSFTCCERADLVARISIISRRCHTVMFYVMRKSNFAMRVNNTFARTFHAAAARSQ